MIDYWRLSIEYKKWFDRITEGEIENRNREREINNWDILWERKQGGIEKNHNGSSIKENHFFLLNAFLKIFSLSIAKFPCPLNSLPIKAEINSYGLFLLSCRVNKDL